MLNMINRGRMPKAVTDEFENLFSRLNGIFARLFDTDGSVIPPAIETEWITILTNQSMFSASGSMTWTVPDQRGISYKLSGKTLIVSFAIRGTSVGGSVSSELQIKLPENCVSVREHVVPCFIYNNSSSVLTTGVAYTRDNQSTLWIQLTNFGNFTASSGLTGVFGQITIEVL